MTLVQQSQGIENFYSNLFSFMRRKTDFYTHEEKVKIIVQTPLEENAKLFKADKQKQEAIKKKQEQEKQKKLAEETAKKASAESSGSATVEEVTDEEAERIM